MRSSITCPEVAGITPQKEIVMRYFVAIKEELSGEFSTGEIFADSIDYQDPEGWIGERVLIHTQDENGNPEEQRGILLEVLDERRF